MIVTLKTLQQQTFKIEIDGEATVKILKEKIEKEKGADSFPAGGQKLIYAGKILDDEKPVSLYKIEEKSFVVVMLAKPKPANTVSVPGTASSPTATQSPSETSIIVPTLVSPTDSKIYKQEETSEPPSSASSITDASFVSESDSVTSTTATERSQSQSRSSLASDISATSAESALVTGQQYEDVVEQMINMGFPREQVQRAMRASFNNPDRAVEYLFNGIPEMPREEAPPAAPTQQSTNVPAHGIAARQPAGAGAHPPMSVEEALAFLRDHPQFQHMRNLIQTNPQLLPEFLQQIGRSNPQLLQMISQNQEQFIAMLNEQVESAQGGVGGDRSPGDGVIQVTHEEKEAIERLKALGFSEAMCIQAYFACEKNEELAANYLLSHGFDDDDS